MRRRTGSEPTTEDTFLWRICKALDEPPRMLAANAGIRYDELEPLLAPRHLLVEIDRDETWWKISEYVDRKLGLIMAIRLELNRALEQDRAKRAARHARAINRTPKGSPRGRPSE